VPDAVITVICAPDDRWNNHLKHVERAVYRNIINCIQSHLVGQLLTMIHEARTHAHKNYTGKVIVSLCLCLTHSGYNLHRPFKNRNSAFFPQNYIQVFRTIFTRAGNFPKQQRPASL